MVQKGIRGGICYAIHHYAKKANHKYTKNYDKYKISPYFKYWDINSLCGWLPLSGSKWVKERS